MEHKPIATERFYALQCVFKVAIWISYLEAEHSSHFFIIFGDLLITCNKSVFGARAVTFVHKTAQK